MNILRRLFYSRAGLLVRSSLLISNCFLLLWSATPTAETAAIENERRLTRLETKVEQMAADLKELKDTDWLKLAALALLTGELGVRHIVNRRIGKKE